MRHTYIMCGLLILSVIGLGLVSKYAYIDLKSQCYEGVCNRTCDASEKFTYYWKFEYYEYYKTLTRYELIDTNYSAILYCDSRCNSCLCDETIKCYYCLYDVEETLAPYEQSYPYAIVGICILSVLIVLFIVQISIELVHMKREQYEQIPNEV